MNNLSNEKILELKKAGYLIREMDQDPILYAWMHKDSGASQRDVKDRQPYRLSEAQAWHDCQAYVSGDVPSTPDSDWIQR